MSLKCRLGLHSWDGCKCADCERTRDEGHDWLINCEKCSKCGKTRNNQHDWTKDCEKCIKCNETRSFNHDFTRDCEKCSKCGKIRENIHNWKGCKCVLCVKTREEQHDWLKDCETCSNCGKIAENQHDWSKDCLKCSKCSKIRLTQHEWNGEQCAKCGKKIIIQWVSIPGGTFLMGSPQSELSREVDELQHRVTLSGFKMSKFTVTFDEYDFYCEVTGESKPKDYGWGRGTRPVINVSWFDANKFAKWMGCRLPTEAEWEYACRAGTDTPFNTGNDLTTDQANYRGNSKNSQYSKNGIFRGYTLPVGSFAPNAWGLYDMHGNVFEWCSDWNGEYPTERQINPKGPISGTHRIIRGGSAWYGYSKHCRSASRGGLNPRYDTPLFSGSSDSHYCQGIRLVKDL